MIWKIETFFRRVRRSINRSEWARRLLELPFIARPEESLGPGLLMVQIDGLAKVQFEQALANGRLPFLQKILAREHYVDGVFYSGLPSSTPAVQGEIFYGKKTAVPAFAFYRKDAQKVFKMFDAKSALQVEQALQREKAGLLAGGSSYSNVYLGGADEGHFCSQQLGWAGMLEGVKLWRLLLVFGLFFPSLIRIVGLAVLETLLALVDFVRGLVLGESLIKELKFIPTRISVSIILREWMAIGAKLDMVRGFPVIHLNFLGYDEQAHRRGPDSFFAHWTLKGIDRTLARLWKAAHRSHRRNYAIWLYSDHGQERVESYLGKQGASLQKKLETLFYPDISGEQLGREDNWGISHWRGTYLGGHKWQRWFGGLFDAKSSRANDSEQLHVAAMGPLGLVTFPHELTDAEKLQAAQKMSEQARLPLVFFYYEAAVQAYTRKGLFPVTTANLDKILGYTHPVAEWLCEDIIRLVEHPDSGDFICSGWSADKPMSFPLENGAHGGPGLHETQGFYLLPRDAFGNEPPQPIIRGVILHELSRAFLQHKQLRHCKVSVAQKRTRSLRVLTWNIHGCRGMDGQISTHRVIRVLRQCEADIIALQEVDQHVERSHRYDQSQEIAAALGKDHSFHSIRSEGDGRYGLALLSKFPLADLEERIFTEYPARQGRVAESRGFQRALLHVNGTPVVVVNTHLGLSRHERMQQTHEIKDVLQNETETPPPVEISATIICGDLNALPTTAAYKNLTTGLLDVQKVCPGKPSGTFPSKRPIMRLDHILVSPEWEVDAVQVVSTQLARVASDHLPVLVELHLPEGR